MKVKTRLKAGEDPSLLPFVEQLPEAHEAQRPEVSNPTSKSVREEQSSRSDSSPSHDGTGKIS